MKAGSTSDETICTTDLYATLADILGQRQAIPARAAEDSFTILPALQSVAHRKPLRPFTIHHSINGSFAIRRGPWKLILCPGSGGLECAAPRAGVEE